MADTAHPWATWSVDWVQRDTFTDRPPLDGLNGHILTVDHPDGTRDCWKVTGGELVEIPPRLCQICREGHVGRGGQMCPTCFDRIDSKSRNDPYGEG
jgi:hypothetical protein